MEATGKSWGGNEEERRVQANIWGVAGGSGGLKIHLIRWKPGERQTKVILE